MTQKWCEFFRMSSILAQTDAKPVEIIKTNPNHPLDDISVGFSESFTPLFKTCSACAQVLQLAITPAVASAWNLRFRRHIIMDLENVLGKLSQACVVVTACDHGGISCNGASSPQFRANARAVVRKWMIAFQVVKSSCAPPAATYFTPLRRRFPMSFRQHGK